MGKASRAKAERRRRQAEFGVFCPGSLDVLSIGKGDLKLTVGGDPDDTERARELIEEMMRKGYAIFVETDEGPVRVTKFNPKRMTYTIGTEVVEEAQPEQVECPACHKPLTAKRYDLSAGVIPRHRRSRGNSPFCEQEGQPFGADAVERPEPVKRKKEKQVPVAGSKATAVGRTAGGAGPRDATPEEMAKVEEDITGTMRKLDAARAVGRLEGYPAELDGRMVTVIAFDRGGGEHVPIAVAYNGVLHEALDVFVEGTLVREGSE